VSLARAIVAELAMDREALAELRTLVAAPDFEPARPVAYTTGTLARDLGLSPRCIRGAIQRGELHAERRGRHYIISASAVETWTATNGAGARSRSIRASRGARSRVMTAALADLDTTR
jgi:excisionase family DNA binding protein